MPDDGGGHAHDEIHMPPNSWWPLVAAVGLTLSLTGIVIGLEVLVPGIIILLVGAGGWVVDARKEYSELP